MSGPTDKTYGGLTLDQIKGIYCPNGNKSPHGLICELAAEVERLRAVSAELMEALREAEECFDARADAEYHTDSPQPTGNEEMRLLVLVRDAIAKAKGEKT
jgi:hypothetical protein